MAEAVETEVQTEADDIKQMSGGFKAVAEDIPAAPPTTEQPPAAAQQQEDPPAPPADPPAEEYVQLTKKDFERIMAALPKAETVDAEIAKVFGTIGNVKNDFLNRLKTVTPAGGAIKIADEDFAELSAEYPELAGHTKAALERILSRMGTGGTGEPATLDPEKLKEAVKTARETELVQEVEALHPGWIKDIGKPDDAENPYRKWLASQPEAYQKRVNNTFSPLVIAESLDRWKASQASPTPTPAPTPTPRPNRFRAAVQPRGTGTAPPPNQPTPEEEMGAAFRRASG